MGTKVILNQFSCLTWHAKVKLFLSQCSSLYGSPLWNLDDPNIDVLCTAWKVCCRRILNIKPDSRSELLHHVMNTLPIKDMIMSRQLSFMMSGIKHDSSTIASFFSNSLLSNTSFMTKNVNIILKHLNLDYGYLFSNANKARTKSLFYNNMNKPDWRSNLLRELLDLKEYISFCDFMRESEIIDTLNRTEILDILDDISRSRIYP